MSELQITVPGEPVSKARPRVTRNGTYTPSKSKAWERACAKWAGVALLKGTPLSGPLGMRVTAFFAIPSSWPQWKRDAAENDHLRHTARPDGDNILKACKDALNGVVWIDDSYVVNAAVSKNYSTEPRVEITVYEIDAKPCQISRRGDLFKPTENT